MNDRTVAIASAGVESYPEAPPYHPPEDFPELPGYARGKTDPGNHVYRAVRDLFRLLGLDAARYGTPEWNPLGDVIKPGDNVVIKPNFVRQATEAETDIDAVVTHASVLRPVVDYASLALRGSGRLSIADAPQFDADYDKVIDGNGARELVRWLNEASAFKVELLDLRAERVEYEGNVITRRFDLAGDPRGYTTVDLGRASAFAEIEHLVPRIYGADYDVEETQRHHQNGVHEYYVANTILMADVVLCVPKLKTHKKAGITVSLKNLVGINGNKNYLPHHRIGPKSKGGDEFEGEAPAQKATSFVYNTALKTMGRWPASAKLFSLPGRAYGFVKKFKGGAYGAGNWHGNDTIWRTTLDLNKILLYGRTDGKLHPERQRRYLSIVDGIIAGEREGPLNPSAKPTGLVLAGSDPVTVDMTCARLMGFDPLNIPTLREALRVRDYPLGGAEPAQLRTVADEARWRELWTRDDAPLDFEPHSGWKAVLAKPKA